MTFHSARVRLTAIYTLILALVLATFSIIIYNLAMEEVYRSVQEVRIRLRDEYGIFMRPERVIVIDTEALNAARKNIIARLFLANITVLAVASGASYYLAGRTLKPIQRITKQQQQFLTDASHELRTPLTVMKSTTEVSLRDKNLTISDAKAALKDNLEEIDRLQRLTSNLLTLSLNEDGGGLEVEPLPILHVVNKAIQLTQHQADAKQTQFDVQLQATEVLADEDSLIEVLVILLENAVKYSPPVSTIYLTSGNKGDQITITIRDQGPGLSPEVSQHIFDRFYRAENSRTTKGFGLGLAIAKKLVAMQDGSISVHSAKGEGSTFILTLPKP